jgi:hypothetical protein
LRIPTSATYVVDYICYLSNGQIYFKNLIGHVQNLGGAKRKSLYFENEEFLSPINMLIFL